MEEPVQLSIVRFFKGAHIFVEGKKNSDFFFIIQQGRVMVLNEEETEFSKEEILGPGDFFGVVSTMSSHSHIESVIALSNVKLIKVLKSQYVGLIQRNTPLAIKIIKQFSKKLRQLNQTLAKKTLKSSAEDDDPSHLFNVGEYYYSQKQMELAYYAYYKYIKHCPNGKNIEKTRGRISGLDRYKSKVKTEYDDNNLNRLYFKNSLLFAEGEPGDELFVIQKGSIKITKIVNNKEVLLAVLKEGDILGEMALLEGKPRAASALTYEDCVVMAVNKSNFEIMIKTQPQLIARVTILLAERIWLIYKQLANTAIINPLGRMYDALLIQLEKNRVYTEEQSSYTFSFGPDELSNMIGVHRMDGRNFIGGIIKTGRIKLINDKIHAVSVQEIAKQAEFYRRISGGDRSRHGNRWVRGDY